MVCEGAYAGGVTVDKSVTIEGRAGADRADVRIAETSVDATCNGWGTVNRTEIAGLIFNDEDDDGSECAFPDDGEVVFDPRLAFEAGGDDGDGFANAVDASPGTQP